jgi:hypothetical protein
MTISRVLMWAGTAMAIALIAQSSRPAGAGLMTSWGEPDLQGIWADEYTTPLQRPARWAGKETLTDAERAELDKQKAARERAPFTQTPGVGNYGPEFTLNKPTGRRTSLIVDPPDGRIPAIAPPAQKRLEEERQFYLGTIQATDLCKNKTPACEGGTYRPVSPEVRAQRNAPIPASVYPIGGPGTAFINRSDGPEERGLNERCLGSMLPDFNLLPLWNSRGLTQSPGQVSIFYDAGQGQGWHRIIPVDGSPHLPASVRLWWGDSRGHWEGNTLVVDVTNFSSRTDFQNSRENLHLVERWTRTGPTTLEYVVTLEDATAWTRPWTVKQEYQKQDDRKNQIFKEPRCHEGNFGMIGGLSGARAKERAFAEGKGPDPAAINDMPTTGGARMSYTFNDPPNYPDKK